MEKTLTENSSFYKSSQRAGGWCEPVRKKVGNLTPESTLRRTVLVCVTEYGRPVIGFELI